MVVYVGLILPLALKETYHYVIDLEDCPEVTSPEALIGCRAVVSFGRVRFYTGVIASVSMNRPEALQCRAIKSVSYLLDESPLISREQLQLWYWLADYYACDIGQVLRTAVPSGLLPESQTLIYLNPNFVAEHRLSPIEYAVLDALADEGNKGMKLAVLRGRISGHIGRAYSRLVSMGAIYTEETVLSRYRPRLKAHLQLTEAYRSPSGLEQAFELLRRAKGQQRLLLEFVEELNIQKLPWDGSLPRLTLSRGEGQRTALIKKIVERGIWQVIELAESRIDTSSLVDRYGSCSLREVEALDLPEGVSYLETKRVESKEWYIIRLVATQLAQGKQVLLLTPSAHDTPSAGQYLSMLEQVSSGRLYYYHSQTSEAKRTELYQLLSGQETPCLVVGTRQAVFLPMKSLSLIIVDDEHEYMYKQQFASPQYHARDVALYLGASNGIRVLMTSATPSAEARFNVLRGKYHRLSVDQTYTPLSLPKVQVIDTTKEQRHLARSRDALVSLPLEEEIARQLQAGRRVLLLQNRRGYALYVRCNLCHEVLTCPHCNLSLKYYATHRLLRCHYCEYCQPIPTNCPHCGGGEVLVREGVSRPALALCGSGVERVEAEVEELFPEARVLRIDSDSLQTQRQRKLCHERIEAGDVDIIVGTQLIKGQPLWDNVGLIAVLQLDAMISYPDFRGSERAYQLLYQLMLRSVDDGGHVPCRVIVQTAQPRQPFIERLQAGDYEAFMAQELSERQLTHFPPFSRLSLVRFKGYTEREVEQVASLFVPILRRHLPDITISDVQIPRVARVDGQYIREVVCRRPYAKSYKGERQGMRAAERELYRDYEQLTKRIQIQYDIDPL